jgi:hypothetical protein
MAIGDMTPWAFTEPRIVTPGGVPLIIVGAEEASQSYVAGEFVILDGTSGEVEAPTAGQALGAGIVCAGIAQKAASGTAATDAPYLAPDVNSEIVIRVNDGSGNVEAANTTCIISDTYDLYIGANGECFVDSSTAGTNEKVTVIDFIKDVNGDVSYWCKVRPIAGAWGNIGLTIT